MQLRLRLRPVHRMRQKPTTGSSHEIDTKTGTQDETETYDWFKPRPVHRMRQKSTTGSSHEIETKTGTQDETETYDWFKPRD